MLKNLEKIITALADTNSGWVARRDAAEALGEVAKKSLAALKAHANEKDTDVRAAVERALAQVVLPPAQASSGGESSPAAEPVPPTMKELALACVKKPKRAVRREGNGFVVRSAMKDGRTQDVLIARFTREDGRELIRVSTECGPADAETIAWAVRNNSQCMYCAFNVEARDGVDHLTILSNFDPKHVTPGMVRDAVKEMAYYGDWLEQKLTGEDAH
jgi:hypothetical protein